MTDSESSFLAIILGLGVFAIIVAVGWRSVQNRRILRLQGANGQETIIVAREGDEVSSVVTTADAKQPAPAPAPAVLVVNPGIAHPGAATELGHSAAGSETAGDVEAADPGLDRPGQ